MIRSTQHAGPTQRFERRSSAADIRLRSGDEPPLASHLTSRRLLYTHHGIYAGHGRVIHYAGFAYGLRRGPVEVVSLAKFAHGHAIRVRPDTPCFSPREVLERALSRLGERRYRVLSNNCEHFCAWVLRGESHSDQVERLRAAPHVVTEYLRVWWSRSRQVFARRFTLRLNNYCATPKAR